MKMHENEKNLDILIEISLKDMLSVIGSYEIELRHFFMKENLDIII